MAKTAKKDDVQLLDIPPIERSLAQVVIHNEPMSSLIMHKFGEKMKKQIAEKEQGKAKNARPVRDPEQEYMESMYMMPDGETPAIPCRWVKASMVEACRNVENINMTQARGWFFVKGLHDADYAEIVGKHNMHSDTVLVGGKGKGTGSATMRYRGEFKEWKATIVIDYRSDLMTLDSLINLLLNAGYACGLGEMRPGKTGLSHGMFTVGKVTTTKRSRR